MISVRIRFKTSFGMWITGADAVVEDPHVSHLGGIPVSPAIAVKDRAHTTSREAAIRLIFVSPTL